MSTRRIYNVDQIDPADLEGVTTLRVGNCQIKSLTVPESVTDLRVGNCQIKSLTVPESVTTLRVGDCPKLASLTVPEGVTDLRVWDCPKLASLTVPEGVTDLRVWDCPKLASLTVPESVTDLRVGNCQIKSLTVPESVTDLRVENCPKLAAGRQVVCADTPTGRVVMYHNGQYHAGCYSAPYEKFLAKCREKFAGDDLAGYVTALAAHHLKEFEKETGRTP
jgi:hypothetical protein